MEDLAMMVSALFAVVLTSGPLAVLFASSRMPILGGLMGLLAVVSGLHLQASAPFGVGLLGVSSAILGMAAIGRACWGINQ